MVLRRFPQRPGRLDRSRVTVGLGAAALLIAQGGLAYLATEYLEEQALRATPTAPAPDGGGVRPVTSEAPLRVEAGPQAPSSGRVAARDPETDGADDPAALPGRRTAPVPPGASARPPAGGPTVRRSGEDATPPLVTVPVTPSQGSTGPRAPVIPPEGGSDAGEPAPAVPPGDGGEPAPAVPPEDGGEPAPAVPPEDGGEPAPPVPPEDGGEPAPPVPPEDGGEPAPPAPPEDEGEPPPPAPSSNTAVEVEVVGTPLPEAVVELTVSAQGGSPQRPIDAGSVTVRITARRDEPDSRAAREPAPTDGPEASATPSPPPSTDPDTFPPGRGAHVEGLPPGPLHHPEEFPPAHGEPRGNGQGPPPDIPAGDRGRPARS